MDIFTSCYSNVPNIDKNAYTLVRVSRTAPPDWFTDSHVDLSDTFGPSRSLLDEFNPLQENWAAFEPRYIEEVLGALDRDEVAGNLTEIYRENGEKPLLLLCYETPDEHCHRHLLGDFLGMETKEL